MQYKKVCVEIEAKFFKTGGIRPLEILWEDGRRYGIERVKYIERAFARVGSVLPVRFTCVVGGADKYLYYEPEEMRWFVEVREE